jgi:hypothetical protein
MHVELKEKRHLTNNLVIHPTEFNKILFILLHNNQGCFSVSNEKKKKKQNRRMGQNNGLFFFYVK